MDVKEAIENRKSIRRYQKSSLNEEKLQILLRAIQLAPSASNRQPYEFVIVKDDDLKKELSRKCLGQSFIRKAGVVFVAIGDATISRWYKIDIAIAMEHIALQAVEIGLASCWIGAFEEHKVKELLKVPEKKRVVALMAVGLPAQHPPARPRKSMDELFKFNYYQ